MKMKEQMIAELENIYADTWDYFDKNKDQDSSLFSKVGTNNLGFAWLYTPPIYKPKLLICGQNPGNYGYHYDDEYDREMLKGEIPIINTYTAGRDGISYPFEFAKFIRKHLDKTAERKELLDTNTVGMNIFPFQYKGSATLSGKKNKEHKAFFKKLSIKIVKAIQPESIICIGVTSFDLINKNTAQGILKNEYKGKFYRYFAKGRFGDKPVYLVAHPSKLNQGVPPEKKDDSFNMALNLIELK